MVVHFDQLKQFTAHLNQQEISPVKPDQPEIPLNQSPLASHIGNNLELCDPDDDDDFVEPPPAPSRHYSSHPHHPPAHLRDYVCTS